MLKSLAKFLTPLAVLVLAFSITVTAMAQERTGPVKFEGTVITDEQYGGFVCYDSYYKTTYVTYSAVDRKVFLRSWMRESVMSGSAKGLIRVPREINFLGRWL
jgi:hypothetical protein